MLECNYQHDETQKHIPSVSRRRTTVRLFSLVQRGGKLHELPVDCFEVPTMPEMESTSRPRFTRDQGSTQTENPKFRVYHTLDGVTGYDWSSAIAYQRCFEPSDMRFSTLQHNPPAKNPHPAPLLKVCSQLRPWPRAPRSSMFSVAIIDRLC